MRFLGSLLILFLSCGVWAGGRQVLNTSAAPYFLNSDRSYLPHKVLGATCSSFRSITKEPACNAAMLGENQVTHLDNQSAYRSFLDKGYFGANIFFGDDYETLYKNKDVLAANDKMALAESLLSEEKPIQFSGAANLWWRGEKLAVVYQPLRMSYFSFVKNKAYPDIVVHAMQEQSVAVQAGGFLSKNWRAGLQVRLVDRKFVHEEFNLFEAIPQLDNYLQLKSQRILMIEPGVAYEIGGDEDIETWRPLLTAQLSNLGFADRLYDEVPSKGVIDTGFSVSPPVSFGEVEIGLNYRWNSEIDGDKKFRLASQYRLGLAGFLFAIDPDQWSLGVLSSFRSVSAGLMYERTRAVNFNGGSMYEDSGYVEFRLSL